MNSRACIMRTQLLSRLFPSSLLCLAPPRITHVRAMVSKVVCDAVCKLYTAQQTMTRLASYKHSNNHRSRFLNLHEKKIKIKGHRYAFTEIAQLPSPKLFSSVNPSHHEVQSFLDPRRLLRRLARARRHRQCPPPGPRRSRQPRQRHQRKRACARPHDRGIAIDHLHHFFRDTHHLLFGEAEARLVNPAA